MTLPWLIAVRIVPTIKATISERCINGPYVREQRKQRSDAPSGARTSYSERFGTTWHRAHEFSVDDCGVTCRRVGQARQLNLCNVPESPSQARMSGSDQRLPLLLARSILSIWKPACAAAPATFVGCPAGSLICCNLA